MQIMSDQKGDRYDCTVKQYFAVCDLRQYRRVCGGRMHRLQHHRSPERGEGWKIKGNVTIPVMPGIIYQSGPLINHRNFK